MTFFYGHLFAAEPEIRAMFPAAMGTQHRRFYRVLSGDASRDYLEWLGRTHRKYGVRGEHYPAMRAALVATCQRFGLREADEAAVTAAFDRAAAIMIAAAAADEALTPAWWAAEVTRHELVARDIAVLAIQPQERVDYLPGQHVSVLSPRWPRQWRRYSVANAPRPDGALTLHVRAVPGGLVSTALVHHTQPGDILLLGPAEGTMTAPASRADGAAGRDVLCLGGGTGLAPLLAITEAVIGAAAAGRRPQIALYHGARTTGGLYAVPMLRRLAAGTPVLTVVPVTSVDRVPHVMHGTVAELAPRAPWRDRDIYISGPDAMIIATVRALLDAGADPGQLRYDLPG
jgi:NAD(P)H-flavin reductase/hemoglobin-like flavoprotein